MFGRQDDNNPQVNGAGPEPQGDAMLPQASTTYSPTDSSSYSSSYGSSPSPSGPPAPSEDSGAGNFMAGDSQPAPSVTPPPASDAADTPAPAASGSSDDLLDLKQSALQQLTPLIGHLEQTPEEKFRTTMMMIQAADNKDLLKSAYDAAQAIPDEKARAQALLDVINEINYFTQQPHHEPTS
jgi:hypothetical protein